MKSYKSWIILLVQFLLVSYQLHAKINLPSFFADHMVLQQNSSVPVWGWGDTNEELTITGSRDSVTVTSRVNNHAAWHVELKTPSADGPYDIMIRESNDSLLKKDILIVEVCLASGQSNMERSPIQIHLGKAEVAHANYPSILLFQASKRTAASPKSDMGGNWKACTPSSILNFSAVAYFFARELYGRLNIPIGIIHGSWGGTGAGFQRGSADLFSNCRGREGFYGRNSKNRREYGCSVYPENKKSQGCSVCMEQHC